MKSAIVAGRKREKEKTMKFINAADLTFKTDAELLAIICEISETLEDLDPSSPEFTSAVCSLSILRRALTARRNRIKGPKF